MTTAKAERIVLLWIWGARWRVFWEYFLPTAGPEELRGAA